MPQRCIVCTAVKKPGAPRCYCSGSSSVPLHLDSLAFWYRFSFAPAPARGGDEIRTTVTLAAAEEAKEDEPWDAVAMEDEKGAKGETVAVVVAGKSSCCSHESSLAVGKSSSPPQIELDRRRVKLSSSESSSAACNSSRRRGRRGSERSSRESSSAAYNSSSSEGGEAASSPPANRALLPAT
ncbi:hypothetical protein C2845_PM06G23790 [Panicum miliaceum]|uniref:Uncharacterized protein n=1 Tax=Panicum miliaceum TaxID=4540 RepID=A0A3L6R9Y8_PANMI|nr:hypothetical protein C2845_PM06G23790 [Panicum miliaceum]